LQTVNVISPIKWSILSLEGAMWRGLSWGEILFPLAIQLAIGGIFFALAIWMIRKQEI
jgi:ABC-2 type transport system permease protein